MIDAAQISFGYGPAPLFDGLQASFPDGRITAVLGPNGSGKSTLLRLCARLLAPQSGRILVSGRSAADYEPKAFAREVAFLPQSRPVPMITVRSLVAHGRFPHLGMTRRLGPRDEEAVDRSLELVGLTALAGRDLRTLSGGQRQKAYIAMLIAQGAQHLLLDEPMTYLDVAHQLELMDILRALRSEGRCIALVMHDVPQALTLADDALVLHEGRALYAGPADCLADSGAIEAAFGVRAAIRPTLTFERI